MNAGGAGESAQERDNAAKCGKRSGKRYTAPIELGFEGGGPWVTMCWKRAGGSRIEAIRDMADDSTRVCHPVDQTTSTY